MLKPVVFIIVALVAIALSGIAPVPTCPPITRDDLLYCVNQADINGDMTIDAAEIDTFLATYSSCLPAGLVSNVNGALIIAQCDLNADMNLTVADDWDPPGACFQRRSMQTILCQGCQACGILAAP